MGRCFYVMRHGASEANLRGQVQGLQDIPLAQRGRVEARAAGEALREQGITAIYASPLQRAAETAQIVAEVLSLSVIPMDALLARNLGTWAARPRSEIKAMWSDLQHPFRCDPHFAPPEGESLAAVEERLWKALDPLLSGEEMGKPLFVTHLVSTGAMVARFAGERPSFHNAEVWAIFPDERHAARVFCPQGDLLEGVE
jgi:probable phosphoglycerate mutase